MIVDVFFKNISLKLSAHYDDIELILHFVDILKNTSKVSINGDYIELSSELTHLPENHFLQFCAKKLPNPIIEINKLDAKALIEEVILQSTIKFIHRANMNVYYLQKLFNYT